MELMYTGAECEAQTSESDCSAVASEISGRGGGSSAAHSNSQFQTKLAVDGDTWVVVRTALTNSDLAMTGASVGTLTSSDVALLRGRRLQDTSLELFFEATFSDDTSASCFANEVEANSETLVPEFETQAASDLGVTVSATLGELTVTATAGSTTLEEASGTTTATSTDEFFNNGTTVRGTLLGTFALIATVAFFD